MLTIKLMENGYGSYCACISNDDGDLLAANLCFDEALGVIAAAMLRPEDIPYTKKPIADPVAGADACHLTVEQYKELVS